MLYFNIHINKNFFNYFLRSKYLIPPSSQAQRISEFLEKNIKIFYLPVKYVFSYEFMEKS